MARGSIGRDELDALLRRNSEIEVLDDEPRSAAPPTRRRKQGAKSGQQDALIEKLLAQLSYVGVPAPRREHVFHPTRQWRFDMDWQEQGAKVAVEVDGGIWMQTASGYSKGHAHPKRFIEDLEKINEAQLLGWTVYRVAADHIHSGLAVRWIAAALRSDVD